jgi:hypothetical protein
MSDFDFDDWVTHLTVRTIDVTLNNRHDSVYYARMSELLAALEDAESKADEVAASLEEEADDDDSLQSVGKYDAADVAEAAERIAGIEAEIEALEASNRADDITVTVRALTRDVVLKITREHLPPVKIKKLANDASDEEIDAWRERMLDWYAAERDANLERDIHMIAAATECVTSKSGTADSISVESLRKMAHLPHGITLITPLIRAVNEATQGEVEADRPKSQGLSTNGN